MKKFFKVLGIIIGLALVFILAAGLLMPREYHFERSITINAPKDVIWKNISMFSNFQKWDPWLVHDPKMKRTITGTDGTPGAVYSWEGNDDVGSGSQTYKSLQPMERVDIDLHFLKPFENRAAVFYLLQNEGNSVKVVWGFDTRFPYPMNALTMFMNMDENLDKDFSTGLANLKKLCESSGNMTAYQKEKVSISEKPPVFNP
jgi:ABC-type antimicrobial peptide transport system permease subunit